eukprot:127362-Chlamydomonas_euryale.AAC.5
MTHCRCMHANCATDGRLHTWHNSVGAYLLARLPASLPACLPPARLPVCVPGCVPACVPSCVQVQHACMHPGLSGVTLRDMAW